MASDDEISIKISSDLTDIKNDLAKLTDLSEKKGEEAGNNFAKVFSSKMRMIAAAAASAIAAIGIEKFIEHIVDEASQAEKAITSMNIALANAGNYSKKASFDLQDLAKELQKTTLYSDETVMSVSTLAQNLNQNLKPDELIRVTKGALDLASAMGVDAETGVRALSKAMNGNFDSLGRMGIKLNEAAASGDTFNNTLNQIEKRFKGASEASSQTFSGTLTKLKNAFSDVLEALGNFIIKSPTIMKALNTILTGVQRFVEYLETAKVGDIFAPLASGFGFVNNILGNLYNLVKSIFTQIISALEPVYNFVINNLIKPFQDLLSILTLIGSMLVTQAVGWFKIAVKAIEPFAIAISIVLGKLLEAIKWLSEGLASLNINKAFEGMLWITQKIGWVIVNLIFKPLELTFNVIKLSLAAIASALVVLADLTLKMLIFPIQKVASLIGGDVKKSVDSVADSILKTMDTVKNKVFDFGEQSIMKVFDFSISDEVYNQMNKTKEVVKDVKDNVVQSMREFKNAVQEVYTVLNALNEISFIRLYTSIRDAFLGFNSIRMTDSQKWEAYVTNVKQGMVQLGQTLKNTLVTGFANAFQSIGAALVEGTNVFDAFGKSILSMLGDVAIQIGLFLITTGAGFLFLPGGQGNGWGLIAGGFALQVLGGALKALAGGAGKNKGSVSSSGGGVAAGGGNSNNEITSPTGNAATASIQTERQTPSTNVSVNVQGNILDRRESGLAIAEILKETFDTNGVIVNA